MVLRKYCQIFCLILIFILNGVSATLTTSSGIRCYTCSFTVNKPYVLRECVNNTDVISIRQYTRPCEHYCYTEERFNIRTKEVDSVFRSCRDYQKNGCTEEGGFITCTYSCMGSLCNNITVGVDHVIHCDNNQCSMANVLKTSLYLFIILNFFRYI